MVTQSESQKDVTKTPFEETSAMYVKGEGNSGGKNIARNDSAKKKGNGQGKQRFLYLLPDAWTCPKKGVGNFTVIQIREVCLLVEEMDEVILVEAFLLGEEAVLVQLVMQSPLLKLMMRHNFRVSKKILWMKKCQGHLHTRASESTLDCSVEEIQFQWRRK